MLSLLLAQPQLALTGDLSSSKQMTAEFTKRREAVLALIKDIPGLKCFAPQGAFYIFPDVSYYYGKSNGTEIIHNAASFAFRKELLLQTSYDEIASLAEERKFLKDYTIPLVQLDCMKTILVFSHIHNSFDKKSLLDQTSTSQTNPYMNISEYTVGDFIKEKTIQEFVIERIEGLLKKYDYGKPENKPDVLNQMNEITEKRQKMITDTKEKERLQQNYQTQIDQYVYIQKLINENKLLQEKNDYLENKIKTLINDKIEKIKLNK